VAIYLGIDGGGSKTSCLVGDEDSVLGSGSATGSNIVRVGEVKAKHALEAAIHQACAAANISPKQVLRSCLGMAGAGRPEMGEVVHRIVSSFVSGEVAVVGDTVTTLEAAFGGGSGIVVIAGTGSVAYGRNREGKTARAGGWGYAISDEGSGHWIGRAALAATLRARDEGETPPLLDGIMKLWGSSNHEQVVLAGNAVPPPDYATLVPLVTSAADAGDLLAKDVLARAGAELAALARTVTLRLFSGEETVPVAMSGGVFRHCATVRQSFYNNLRSAVSNAVVNTTVIDPVRGALQLARNGMPEAH